MPVLAHSYAHFNPVTQTAGASAASGAAEACDAAVPPQFPWRLFQSGASINSAGDGASVTLDGALTAGSKLIAYALLNGPGATENITGISDGHGNAFTRVSPPGTVYTGGNVPAGDEVWITVWVLDTPDADAGSGQIITLATAGASRCGMLVQEVAGLAAGAAGSLDGAAGFAGGSSGTAAASPAYASTIPGEFLVSFAGDGYDTGTVTWAAPAGMVPDPASITGGSTASPAVAIAYGPSGGGAESAGWGLSGGGTANFGVLLAGFGVAGLARPVAADGAGAAQAAGAAVTGNMTQTAGCASGTGAAGYPAASGVAGDDTTVPAGYASAAGAALAAVAAVTGSGGQVTSPPESLSPVTVTATTVSLTWGAPAGAVTGYRVYDSGTLVASGATAPVTVPGLAAGTPHVFTVAAYNGAGESPQSLPVYVTTPASGTLATPYPVSHGKYLTINNVGPWALQNVARGSETLSAVTLTGSNNSVDTWDGDPPPPWQPTGTYVYDNSPSNHGGIVPAGGMTIDGFSVPAGTWIAQFYDFGGGTIKVQGDCNGAGGAWPGIMFRGCRFRGQPLAPGFISDNAQSNGGITWYSFCDGGGTYEYYLQQPAAATACEVIWQQRYDNRQVINRCYLSESICFLGIDSLSTTGNALVETFIENQTCWYDPNGSHAGYYHYNVVSAAGMQVAHLLLRNNIVISPQPAQQPWYWPGTVIIQYAADGGAYPGTGTNIDSTPGYQIRDNYLGGTGYVHSFGVDKANTPADVSHVTCTGNQYTTYYFESVGQAGVSYKTCTWGVQGNSWSGNTYADDYGSGTWPSARGYPGGDGPLAGAAVAAPTTV